MLPRCRETVEEGNGILVPAYNAKKLAEAREIYLGAWVDRIDGKGESAIAEEKYDVHQVNSSILNAMGLAGL